MAPELTHTFVDDGLRSRLAVALPARRFKIAATAALDETYPYAHVLLGGGRVLLVGRSTPRWQLFDEHGRNLGLGRLVPGEVVLDADKGLFLFRADDGSLEAHALDDGKLSWRAFLAGTDDWTRAYVARRGPLLVAASLEQKLDPHGGATGGRGVVEVRELAPEPVVADGFLQSIAVKHERTYPGVRRIVAALAGDTLVVAVAGSIDLGGLDLSVAHQLTGSFEPLLLSADERRGAFVVVAAGGKRALWRVGLDATKAAEHELPDDGALLAPPLVGPDGTAYVLCGDRIIAVTDAGLLWSRDLPGLAGATVTADGQVLASVGAAVWALGGDGAETELFSLVDEPLVTPPVLGDDGKLVAASARRLHILEPSR